jgi:hypothetical protein
MKDKLPESGRGKSRKGRIYLIGKSDRKRILKLVNTSIGLNPCGCK